MDHPDLGGLTWLNSGHCQAEGELAWPNMDATASRQASNTEVFSQNLGSSTFDQQDFPHFRPQKQLGQSFSRAGM